MNSDTTPTSETDKNSQHSNFYLMVGNLNRRRIKIQALQRDSSVSELADHEERELKYSASRLSKF